MKLFDRSVDLAQFSEDTPLYPVCRAWIANDPYGVNKAEQSPTVTSTQENYEGVSFHPLEIVSYRIHKRKYHDFMVKA